MSGSTGTTGTGSGSTTGAGLNLGTESSLSNWAGDYVTNMLGQGQALANTPYEAYKGPLTAGTSTLQNNAFTGLASLSAPTSLATGATTANAVAKSASDLDYTPGSFANQYTATSPYTQVAATNQYKATDPYNATTFTSNALTADDVKNYMSGFDINAIQPQIEEARRQAKIDQLANSAALSKSGAWGGSSSLLSELQSQRNLQARLESITASGYKDAYDRAIAQFNADQGRSFEAQKASEASKQFGADQALKNATNTALYGQQANDLSSKENQFAANTALTNADKSAYYGLAGQQEAEKSNQFAADYGLRSLQKELDALKTSAELDTQGFNNSMALNKAMQDAGAQQRAITQEGINADKAQFLEEQQYPYKQVQFLQSLLSGMPLEAQQNTYSTPSALSDILATSGTFLDLMNKAVPSTTTKKAE